MYIAKSGVRARKCTCYKHITLTSFSYSFSRILLNRRFDNQFILKMKVTVDAIYVSLTIIYISNVAMYSSLAVVVAVVVVVVYFIFMKPCELQQIECKWRIRNGNSKNLPNQTNEHCTHFLYILTRCTEYANTV